MEKTVLIILLLLRFSIVNAQDNDSLVPFTKSLEWNRFKGVPDNDTLGARISTSIHLEIAGINTWNGIIEFKAYALMDPLKSWVKFGYADEYNLQHEQTHFNLTEMCAKNLQAELNKIKIRSKKSSLIQPVFAKWQSRLEILQQQYDVETMGGNDHTAQNSWNEKAREALNKSKN